MLALDREGLDGEGQGGADIALIHLAAHDLDFRKELGGEFAGLDDVVVVVVAVL